MADEGAGASLTFATSGTTLNVLNIQAQGVSRESIETTHHGTTGGYKTFIPADFKDPGTIQVTWLYDPDVQPPLVSPTTAAPNGETVTITYPVPVGKANGATEASAAFVTDWDAPDLAIDQRMEATLTLKRSGIITYSTATTA